jgi:flavin reductase (DIM6/NTAB) family NADH-FMN oxidoreductase RutF
MLPPDQVYQLLRNLTSPVVAITSARGSEKNAMIIDSAVRASIVPTIPRIAVFIHKFNYSHDLIYGTGAFGLHLLRTDQFDLIHHLGFQSKRAVDKLATVPHRTGRLGVPVLEECFAHFECRVVNAMDTGSSTCFLGEVQATGFGGTSMPRGEVMTAAYFRANLPKEWKPDYERLLKEAQGHAEQASRNITYGGWKPKQ